MIAEAVDAAFLLWQALWLWMLAGAAVGTLGLLGCGVAVGAVWRMLRAAWTATGPRTDSLAPLAAEQPASDSTPATAPHSPSEPQPRPAPSWTRKDAA